jgi:hypothetical protein
MAVESKDIVDYALFFAAFSGQISSRYYSLDYYWDCCHQEEEEEEEEERLLAIPLQSESISWELSFGLTLNIEWMGAAPSPLFLGTICTCTWGTSWPASLPLWIAIVEALT